MEIGAEYLRVVRLRFHEMKHNAEKAFAQLDDDQLYWGPDDESNSIAVIVKHMAGNMISRWTDFLHTDGEKPDRDRDGEFENPFSTRAEMMSAWEEGWGVFLNALDALHPEQLLETITIRNEPHTVMEAIERQMYHYSYHVGQIVYIAKHLKSAEWITLTIPRKTKK